MTSDVQKYRAQVFQILGFILMTPLGNLILNMIITQKNNLSWSFVLALVTSMILAFCGILLLLKGMIVLEEKSKS